MLRYSEKLPITTVFPHYYSVSPLGRGKIVDWLVSWLHPLPPVWGSTFGWCNRKLEWWIYISKAAPF